MAKFTTFTDFRTPKESKKLLEIIQLIRNGNYKKEIDLLRAHIAEGNSEEASKIKSRLHSFTPTGVFEGARNSESLEEYSNVLHLDFDKLTQGQIDELKDSFRTDSSVLAFFVSPSGNGLKVFFKIDDSPAQHTLNMKKLFRYAKSKWNLTPDEQCIDLPRLCFISYDPEAYFNADAELVSLDTAQSVKLAYQLTESKKEYKVGNRNLFIWEFGRQCKQQNLLLEEAYESSLQKFSDMPKDEIYKTIRSSYMNRYDLPTKNKERISRLGKYAPLGNVLKEEYDFRFNVVTKCVEFKKRENRDFLRINDVDFNNLMIFIDASGHKISQIDLRTILESDFSEAYDPFIEYLDSLPEWDGFDHIGDMASTIEVDNPEYFEKCLKRWLIAMIASVLNDEIVNQHVFTLVGEQGVGKTTWLNNLCPKELKDYVYHGSMKSNDKDSLTMLSESIIINVDELEALGRKQIEEFKELVTKVNVRVRRPYGRYAENMPRRASFCASLNSSEFLNDPTGSRRFLVHWTRAINNNHNLDIDQLYAHALHLYLNNEKYWFDRDEIIQINSMNKQFQVESLEEELLLNHFEPATDINDYMSASEIMLYLQERNEGIKLQVNLIGKMLAKNGFEKVSRKGRKKWLVKKM
jgi:hypothetical protein